MAKQTCVSSLWQKKAKLACLSLAASLFLSACGGGYDGGGTPDQPSPTATPAPVDVPDPTLEPTPPSIEKSEAPSKLEYLNRGLVVVPDTVGNAVSWRLLGTDNPAIVFDVYRNDSKLNETPLTHTTFYKDVEGQADDVYQVRGMVDGTEVSVSASAQPWSAAYHSVPLQRPKDGRVQDDRYEYTANDASVADLDGDGQYEIVLKWMPRNIEEAPSNRVQHGGSRDNSQAGITAHVIFDAYTLEGVHLWRIDLGPNIRAGAHYNPFLVYDFDGDGRAEMAVRTADGSIDGRGVVIGDPDVDYRNENGFITEGPEFVTMFDGLSGEALDSIDYVPARGSIDDWGSNSDNGNRADRFLGAVAYLDGENPSLIMSRGVYARVSLAAFDWVDGAFQQRWLLDTGTDSSHPLFGGGNHNLAVGDVDADGKQEIIYGSGAIDDDGSVLYGTGLCDGDAMHMGDLDPDREGLEVFVPHESSDCYGDYGVEMHDAATGEILWSMPDVSGDIGRGLSANIDPRHPGNENWAARGNLTTAAGVDLGEKPDSINFAIWWEGDLLRELLDGSNIYKWNYTGSEIYTMLAAGSEGAESNNGTKANPSLSADLFGDWREEAIWPNKSHNELMIFSTPHTTNTRMHTLMHDPQYRAAVAWQNVSYNQPPTPSFFVGQGMPQRWESDIAITEGGEWAKLVAQGSDESIDVRLFMNGFDVDAIKLYRDTDDDPEGRKLIATLSGDERSFVDEGDEEVAVVPDVYYYYWAELEGSTASSTIELDVSRTKLTKTLLPSYWVGAIPSQGDVGPVKVIWETENIASDEINIYRVEAASADETPNFDGRSLVGMPEVSATEWVDDSSAPDTAYFYWVEFVDDAAEATYTPAPRYAEHLPIPVINLTAEHIGNTIVVNWELSDFRPAIGSVEVYRNTRNTQDGRTRVVRGASESGTFSDDTPPASATDPDPAIEGRVYWYTLKVVLEDGSQPIIPLVPEGGVFISSGEGKTMVGAWAEAAVVDDNLQLELSWKNYHVDIASVEIFRDTQEDGANRVSMGAVDATATSWKDISPVEGATHYYWVEVTDTDGVVHTSTVTNGVSRPPETNLLAVPAAGGITVSWDLKYFPAELTSIELYRNTSPTLGGRDRIAAGLPMSGSLLDDGTVAGAPLEVGQTYWYMFKLNGGSPNTDPEAEVTYVLVDGTNLVSTQVGNNVELIWNMHGYDFDIASAELYRNDSNSIEGRTKLADVASNGSYVDTGPFVSGTSYWYMFKLNDDVDTDPEAELAYTLPAGTNLSTSLNGDGNIEVSWNLQNYPFDITSVELYRNDRGDKLDGRVRLAQGLESSATFVDDGSVEPLQAGTSYWYMFKLNGAENTSPEAEIVYTGTGIPAATNLTSAINGSAIDLSWDIQGYTLDGTIDLYRNDKDEPNGRVRVAEDVGASGTFSDDGSVEPLFAGVDYWYMFKINGTGENTPVEAQITYGTAPPAGLNMTSAVKSTADGDVIEVRWNLQGFAGQDGTIELYRIQDGVSGRKRISRSVKPWGVFEDNGDDTAAAGDLVSGATYSYQFKFTSNNQSSDAGGEIVFNAVSPTPIPTDVPAATNLTSAINGSAIDLSWDIQGYTLDGTIDLYRNDKDEPNGRVRVAADVGASGTFSDDGSVEPLFAGVDYWYMFKINGTGENTPVEAQITYGTAPPAGLNMTSAVKSTADGDVIEVRWNLQGFAGQDGTIELYRIQDGVSGRKRISRSVKPWGVFEDNGDDTAAVGDLVSGATYSYQFKFTSNNQSSDVGGEIVFNAVSPTPIPTDVPAATNLTSAINGSAIDLSWDIQGYTLDGTIDLYRNDKDEPNGRVRVAADVGASGTFSDDGSVEPLFAGVDYWYMFKINGTGENTPVEAQITYGTAPPAGLNMTSVVKSTADGDVIEVRWNLQGFAGQDGTIELYRIQDGVSGRKRISRSVKPWGVFEDNGDDTAAVGDLVSGATYSYQFKFTSNNQSSDAGGEITFP